MFHLLAALAIPSPALAGGTWTDDFEDNDISDWTVLDGQWSVSGGVLSGGSDDHYGVDLVTNPGWDADVTDYTLTANLTGNHSMGLTVGYDPNTGENCGFFFWSGSALYRTGTHIAEVGAGSPSYTAGTNYEIKAIVSSGNVEIQMDGNTVFDGDLECNFSLVEVGIQIHGYVSSSITMEAEDFSVEWEYVDNDGDGYDEDDGDCNDADASISPGAAEVCDGIDNDCDGVVDEEDATDALTWYADVDGDGYGDPNNSVLACASSTGTVADATDCDDSSAGNFPGATETCDGADNDCDGAVDEDDASDALTWYADVDGDGYGDAASTTQACAQPSGFVADTTDCQDLSLHVNPGATEVCDSIDNDCDGTIDESDAAGAPTWYEDADGDGYGTPNVTQAACSQPSGYTANNDDCNDTTTAAHDGAPEICDGIDNDCDGNADENDATDAGIWYLDADGDGHGSTSLSASACSQPSGYVVSSDDCNDLNASAHPGGTEVCDGADNDCDGTVDEDDATDAGTWYADADGDGFGDANATYVACEVPSGYTDDTTDCDDNDASTWPGAQDTWYDGIDSNCDGASDFDADGDGHDSDAYGGGDCNDENDEIHPAADEIWYDGVDSDCDGASDFDADGDGYDSASYDGDDCDDADADTYPDAPDTPHDGVIHDCNHSSDDDMDGDGFDSAEYGGDDCDDANSAIHPEAMETWYDGVDDNCDGNDDDQDGDGFGVEADCDDLDDSAYPGAPGWTDDCEEVVDDTGLDTGDTGADTGFGDTGTGGETLKGGSRCSTLGANRTGSIGLFGLLGLLVGLRRREARWSFSS